MAAQGVTSLVVVVVLQVAVVPVPVGLEVAGATRTAKSQHQLEGRATEGHPLEDTDASEKHANKLAN